MQLYLRLAWRNIWRHTRRTLTIVSAMAMALALMMLYDGMIVGFEQAIYGNAIKVFGGNVQAHGLGFREKMDSNPLLPVENNLAIVEAARQLPEVVSASRRIITGGLATNREGAFPISIIGIEPEVEADISLFAKNIVEGRYLTATDEDVILIGKGMAEAMGITIGDRITISGRAAREQMRSRTMAVVGIFDIGMPDLEKRSVYISLAEAQSLYNMGGQVSEVTLFLHSVGQEHAVLNALRPQFSNIELDSWENNFPELTAALGTKGGVMDIFSVVILMIAGIGILNLLLMAVYERTREIGLLAALGLRPKQIATLFVLEGTMIGLVGIAAGIALGLVVNAILGQVGIDYSKFASTTEYMALLGGRVYPTLGLESLPKRAITVAIIASLAAIYPASEAARREPAEALHFV